jgi:hypothetical protein
LDQDLAILIQEVFSVTLESSGKVLFSAFKFLGFFLSLSVPAMEITKYRSQLLIALEQAGVHLRQAQNALTSLGGMSSTASLEAARSPELN